MPENCTIYCKQLNLPTLESTLDGYFPKTWKLVDKKSAYLIKQSSSTLRLSPLVFIERADRFSRLLGSTIVNVESRKGSKPRLKKLVSHLEECNLIIGVVAEPNFDAPHVTDLVFEIASQLDGVIFNGDDYLAASGKSMLQSH